MAMLVAGLSLSGLAYQIPTTPNGTWTGTAATDPATKDAPSGLTTMEAASTATFTVVLTRPPTAGPTIALSSRVGGQ